MTTAISISMERLSGTSLDRPVFRFWGEGRGGGGRAGQPFMVWFLVSSFLFNGFYFCLFFKDFPGPDCFVDRNHMGNCEVGAIKYWILSSDAVSSK